MFPEMLGLLLCVSRYPCGSTATFGLVSADAYRIRRAEGCDHWLVLIILSVIQVMGSKVSREERLDLSPMCTIKLGHYDLAQLAMDA
jgi:hypothetical protein